MVGVDSRMLAYSRRNPSVNGVEGQDYVRKALCLIAYSAETLRELVALPPSMVERHELIEQLRLIERERVSPSLRTGGPEHAVGQ